MWRTIIISTPDAETNKPGSDAVYFRQEVVLMWMFIAGVFTGAFLALFLYALILTGVEDHRQRRRRP